MKNAARIAVKDGVPIALGTDAGVGSHGTNAREFGSLKSGLLADVVAVPGDPLADIHVTERPVFAMKNGVVYKSPTMTAPLP